MVRRLQRELKQADVVGYKSVFLGDDLYRFSMPLVRGNEASYPELRAIKPINLTQKDTTRIIDHGELWHRRLERLLALNLNPDRILLPVKLPGETDPRHQAAKHVVDQFHQLDIAVSPFGKRSDIIDFARAA